MQDPSTGLTWNPMWVSEMESPMTILAKLAAANRFPSKSFSRVLLRARSYDAQKALPHARSFLHSGWIRRLNHPVPGSAMACIARATLNNILGGWSAELASDQHFRYCPTCLALGFHSSLCQIDALERCPAHGDPLVATCGSCGCGTPRFVFGCWARQPMRCSECRAPLAAGWHDGGQLRWRATPAAAAYVEMAKAMAPIQHARWGPNQPWRNWMQSSTSIRRSTMDFTTLRRALCPDLEASPFAEIPELPPPVTLEGGLEAPASTTPGRGEEPSPPEVSGGGLAEVQAQAFELPPDRAVVKASLGIGHARFDGFCAELLAAISTTATGRRITKYYIDDAMIDYYLDSKDAENPLPLAYCLFRRRIEPLFVFAFTRLGDYAPPWMANWYRWPEHAVMGAADWDRFLRACYETELGFASLWCRRARGASRTSEQWRAAVTEFRHAWARQSDLPPGLGVLFVQLEGLPDQFILQAPPRFSDSHAAQ